LKKHDPTANVLALVKEAVKRLDDISKVNYKHAKELRIAEAKRIDANRAGDVQAVALANERAINQASVLAKQVTDSAQMLALQLQSMETKLTDRLTLLERSQYLDKGKSGVTSPLLMAIVAFLSVLITALVMAWMQKNK
jgi:hypothetical protein